MAQGSGASMAHSCGGLRTGGEVSLTTGGVAESVGSTIAGVDCPSEVFGTVRGAAELAGALARARTAHMGTCEQVSACHADLGAASYAVAGLGAALDVDAEAVAASGGPGSIAADMGDG